jgi:hypothetical protein
VVVKERFAAKRIPSKNQLSTIRIPYGKGELTVYAIEEPFAML